MEKLEKDFCDAWDTAMDLAFVNLDNLSDEDIAAIVAMFEEDEDE